VTSRKDVLQLAEEVELEVKLPPETAPAVARHTLRHSYADRVDSDLLAETELLVSGASVAGIGRPLSLVE
jgi:hypothetical protein